MTRARITGWTIWIGVCLAPLAYAYFEEHTPAFIATARAQQARDAREVDQTMAQVGCAGDIENHDDGKTPAEAVAKTIIAKCGPFMSAPEGPPCSTDPKCMQATQEINLQTETEGVLEQRYDRAKAQADEAEARARAAANALAKQSP